MSELWTWKEILIWFKFRFFKESQTGIFIRNNDGEPPKWATFPAQLHSSSGWRQRREDVLLCLVAGMKWRRGRVHWASGQPLINPGSSVLALYWDPSFSVFILPVPFMVAVHWSDVSIMPSSVPRTRGLKAGSISPLVCRTHFPGTHRRQLTSENSTPQKYGRPKRKLMN